MPFYWMGRRIPEREALRARGRISEWKWCRLRTLSDWRFWAGVLAALVPVGLGFLAARGLEGDSVTTTALVGFGAVLGSLVLRQVSLSLTRVQARALLLEEIRAPSEADQSDGGQTAHARTQTPESRGGSGTLLG